MNWDVSTVKNPFERIWVLNRIVTQILGKSWTDSSCKVKSNYYNFFSHVMELNKNNYEDKDIDEPINNCEQLNKERNQIRWYSCWWSYRLYFISWFIWNEIVSIKRFSFDELSDVFSKNQHFINSLKID